MSRYPDDIRDTDLGGRDPDEDREPQPRRRNPFALDPDDDIDASPVRILGPLGEVDDE